MSRDLNLLLPKVKQLAEQLKAEAKAKLNLNIIFTCTLRTEAEQQAYYAQGRQSLGTVNSFRQLANLAPITEIENKSIITKAKSVKNSFHAYGMAFDIAVVSPNGKQIVWNNKSDWNGDGSNDWTQVGKLGESLGLEWGGSWSTFADPPHFQYRYGLTIKELIAGKRPEVA